MLAVLHAATRRWPIGSRRPSTEYRAIEAAIPDPDAGPGDRRWDRAKTNAILIRGNHQNPGERRPAAVSGSPGRRGPGDCRRGAAAGSSWPGRWSIRGQSAPASRAGQPALEAPFRRGARQVDRRLRRDGAEAQSSRAARLAGRRVRRPGLVDQGDAPADGHLQHVPDDAAPCEPTPSGSTRPTCIFTG